MSQPPMPPPSAPPAGPAGYPSAPPYPNSQLLQCRLCGCVPAAKVTFRGHRGMLVLMQFRHLKGPFCRDCGLATFRKMTADTLIQGWYGWASFIITPFTVLINLIRRGKVATLPAPQRSPFGSSGVPLDPGPPLLSRPTAIIGLAVPFALVICLTALVIISSQA